MGCNISHEEVIFQHDGSSTSLSDDIEYIIKKINKKISELNYVIDFGISMCPIQVIINGSELKTSFELLKENLKNISNLLSQKYVDIDKTFNLGFDIADVSASTLAEDIYVVIAGIFPLDIKKFLCKYEEQFIHSICNQRLYINSREKVTEMNTDINVSINGIIVNLKNMFSLNAGFDFSNISFIDLDRKYTNFNIRKSVTYYANNIKLSNNISLFSILSYINANISGFICYTDYYNDSIIDKYIMSNKITKTKHVNLVLKIRDNLWDAKELYQLKFFDDKNDSQEKIVKYYYCADGNCNNGKRCKNIINFGNKYITSIMPKIFLEEKSELFFENNNMMPEIIKYIYEVLTKYCISFDISKINGIFDVRYKITINPISVIKTKKPMSIDVPSNLDLTSDIPTSLPSDKSILSVTNILESFAPNEIRYRTIEDDKKIEK